MTKAPTDANQRAKRVLDIVTGVLPKPSEKKAKAVSAGSKGGKAKMAKLTPEQRKEASQKAAKARWSK